MAKHNPGPPRSLLITQRNSSFPRLRMLLWMMIMMIVTMTLMSAARFIISVSGP